MLARALVIAAIAWPVLAGAALWHRVAHTQGGQGLWASAVYLGASRLCHQLPERSFHTSGVSWPVCARCSGLYLAAPFGALMVFARRRAARPGLKPGTSKHGGTSNYGAHGLQPVRLLAFAAIPTALTVLWEWAGMGTPANMIRFTTALPLGAAVMWVLLHVSGTSRIDRIN